MLSTIYLYSVPIHQYTNNIFYIGSSWSSCLVASVANVKTTNTIVQEIILPYASNYEHVNVIKIGYRYYDVTGYDDSSLANESVIFQLEFNPVSTYLTSSTAITGFWENTPTLVNLGAKINIAPDCFYTSRYIALPTLTQTSSTNTFYYQISAMYDVMTSQEDKICLYGGIVPWADQYLTSSTKTSWYIRSGYVDKYVPLITLVNDINEITTIPAADIISLSVSARCPYKTSISGSYYSILNTSEVAVAPLDLAGDYGIIEPVNTIGSDTALTADRTTSHTITLSNFERCCGRVLIVDEIGNTIAEIPTEAFNSSNQLTYYCYCIADVTGLYTIFNYNDVFITIPEGQLPWVSDAWQEYVTYQQTYDRGELSRSITDTNNQFTIDSINSVSSGISNAMIGMMTMGIAPGTSAAKMAGAGAAAGSGSTVLGLATSYLAKENSISSMKKAQSNKEAYIKRQSSPAYQTGYGFNYLSRSIATGGAKIKIEMPKNTTSDDFNNYIGFYGYPCNKYASVTPSATGYLKGDLTQTFTTGTYSVMEHEMLRNKLREGCRLFLSTS